MRNELVRFFKRALVEKKLDPFPRRKLARLLLPLPSLRPATLLGDGMPRGKLREVALM